MAKYGDNIFHLNFFFQNDSEWPEMDFKHNFIKCNILTRETPLPNVTSVTFFFEGVPKSRMSRMSIHI